MLVTTMSTLLILVGLVSGVPAPEVTKNCKRRWGDHHKTWRHPKPMPSVQKEGPVHAPLPAVATTAAIPRGPIVTPPGQPPANTQIPPPAAQSKSVAPPEPAPKPAPAASVPPAPKPSVSDPKPPVPAPPKGDAGNESPVGLGVDYLSHAKASSFGASVSWYHSWSIQTWPGMEGLEFVPTIKNRAMVEAFQAEQLGSAKYALSLNEPDIPSQHDGVKIPETDAAALHNQWTKKVPQGVQVGAVSVARGGKGYFNRWKQACGASCRYDFIPIHFYGLTSKEFISYAKFEGEGKPLWITEIACREYKEGGVIKCNADQTRKLMTESIVWMRGEGAELVHRWSWFGAWSSFAAEGDTNGLLDANGNANELGKYYGSL